MERAVKGIWIPIEIWEDKRLSIIEKGILAEIDSLDGEEHCYASNEHIADFCNCTERTVSSAITKLISLGYISKVSFDGRNRILKSNVKTVICKENVNSNGTINDSEVQPVLCRVEKISMQDGNNFHADTKMTASDNNIYNIINNKENIKEKIKEKYLSETDEKTKSDFIQFWNAYPRHTNTSKKETFKKFCKAITITTLETMLNAIENQKNTKQWIDGFIPMATTWLNQEKWDDEVEIYTENAKEAEPKKEFHKDETPWEAANWLSRNLNRIYPSIQLASPETLQKWAAVFDKMETEDGHPASEILSLMKFAFRDDFWHDKISNPWDMKKHYIKILAKATDEGWFK